LLFDFSQNTLITKSSLVAFVDDADHRRYKSRCTRWHLQTIFYYTKICSTLGRFNILSWTKTLHKKKTTVSYLIMSKFYGKKIYMSKQEITSTYPPFFLSPNFFYFPCKIKSIDASSSKKSLGHHLLLNGDMHQQIARINKILHECILITSTTKVSKHDGAYAYHAYLLCHLCSLLVTTCIKKLIGI